MKANKYDIEKQLLNILHQLLYLLDFIEVFLFDYFIGKIKILFCTTYLSKLFFSDIVFVVY